MDYTGKLSTYR